jgi:hypothetical protein
MRRTLLVVAAMVSALGVAGCAGTGLSFLGGGESHTTASNRARARTDAQRLLALVRVPAGSVLAATPHDTGFEQVQRFIGVLASATASRTWIVHGSVNRLLRYVVAHLRPGSKLESSGSGGSPGSVAVSQIRYWPPVRGVLDGRWLQIEAYTHGGHTYLTARTESQWVVAREANERIPASVTQITVSVANARGQRMHQMTVTKPRVVRRIVGLYNSLGVVQPAIIMGCPPEPAGVLTLRFYTSPTNVIATASSSTAADPHWPASAPAWACFPISIRLLARRRYPSLSGSVITPLGRLLHTKLNP